MKNNVDILFGDTNIHQIDTFSLPESLIEENEHYFAFIASGNGMINAGIKDGDTAIFIVVDKLKNGDIGCVIVDKQPMCKRYFFNQKNNIHILQYEDGIQTPIIVKEDQEFIIVGKLKMILNMKS